MAAYQGSPAKHGWTPMAGRRHISGSAKDGQAQAPAPEAYCVVLFTLEEPSGVPQNPPQLADFEP